MLMTMNVYEAKTKFSNLLSNVEDNKVTVTIVRYGRPVAQIVPVRRKRRSLAPVPELVGGKITGDIFADTSEAWEALGDEVHA